MGALAPIFFLERLEMKISNIRWRHNAIDYHATFDAVSLSVREAVGYLQVNNPELLKMRYSVTNLKDGNQSFRFVKGVES